MRKIALLLLCALLLGSGAAVYAAGDGGDSLVSESYLTDTYLPEVVRQAQELVDAQTESVYQSVLGELNIRQSLYLGEQSYAESLTDVRFKKGDMVGLTAGSGVLLLAGSATVSYSSGAVIDVTAGQTLASGASLPVSGRCLAAEETTAVVTVTSDTAVLSLEGDYIVSLSTETDYNALADALKEMGLLQGTGTAYGSGYDLEQAPTRIVGLVMFLRLIGEEQAALNSTAVNPFVDTPAWCDRYVAYAYEKGYTQGTGVSASGQRYFGPDASLSAEEYVTFLLRALGYSDSGTAPDFSWSTAIEQGVELGLLTTGEQTMLASQSFLRAQVVYLSYYALSATLKDGSGTLLDLIAASSGASKSQLQSVINGVTVQRQT